MKKVLAVLATIAIVSNFGIASFANPCPCSKSPKPCPAVKTQCHKKEILHKIKKAKIKKIKEAKGEKTGGAADLKRPINMTKAEKIEKAKKDAKKDAIKKVIKETK
jgi:hypothetical protein